MFPKKSGYGDAKTTVPAKPTPAGMPDKGGEGAMDDHKGGHGSVKHGGGGMKPGKKGGWKGSC